MGILCSGLSTEDAAWTLANDVLSNWGIENIRLSRESIRNSLASILDLSYSSSVKEMEREKNAAEATYEALSKNEPLSLEYILYLHKKLKNDDENDWGVIRNHSESVYGVNLNGFTYSVYDAPLYEIVPKLMEKFISWWNFDSHILPRPAASILAHLHFVTIHPFRDGNGRMARILADKYMANGSSLRMYSISYEIEKNKTNYYMALESITEKDGMGIFLDYMLSIYFNAINDSKKRSLLLLKVYKFLSYNKIFLLDYEKDLLRMLTAYPTKYWSFIDATKYIDEGEKAEKAWNKFVKLGFITNGQFSIPENFCQGSEKNFIENELNDLEQYAIDKCLDDPHYIAIVPLDQQTGEIIYAVCEGCKKVEGLNPSYFLKYIHKDLKEIINIQGIGNKKIIINGVGTINKNCNYIL